MTKKVEEHGYCILRTEDVSPDPVFMELVARAFQAGYDIGKQKLPVLRQTVCFKKGYLEHWVATEGQVQPVKDDMIPSRIVDFDTGKIAG